MAVLISGVNPTGNAEQYDQSFPRFEARMKQAKGFIAHFARPNAGGGFLAQEIWESREAWETWMKSLNLPPGVPQPQFVELHHVVLKD